MINNKASNGSNYGYKPSGPANLIHADGGSMDSSHTRAVATARALLALPSNHLPQWHRRMGLRGAVSHLIVTAHNLFLHLQRNGWVHRYWWQGDQLPRCRGQLGWFWRWRVAGGGEVGGGAGTTEADVGRVIGRSGLLGGIEGAEPQAAAVVRVADLRPPAPPRPPTHAAEPHVRLSPRRLHHVALHHAGAAAAAAPPPPQLPRRRLRLLVLAGGRVSSVSIVHEDPHHPCPRRLRRRHRRQLLQARVWTHAFEPTQSIGYAIWSLTLSSCAPPWERGVGGRGRVLGLGFHELVRRGEELWGCGGSGKTNGIFAEGW
jgi:hypothetical protein